MNVLSIYLTTAVCACHINHGATGFRQKDVHFYYDLFTNWMESSLGRKDLQNVQVQRFLDSLVKRQILEKTGKWIYKCRDIGLIPLIEDITTIKNDHPLELFFFQYHVVHIYQQRLMENILKKKINLPHGLKIELKYILDRQVLIQKQKNRIVKELEKLELRSKETLEMEKMTTKMFKEGKAEKTVIETVEKVFPYQLHHQKKMSELFFKLEPILRKEELTQNAHLRVSHLWMPMIQYYKDYLNQLEKLEQT